MNEELNPLVRYFRGADQGHHISAAARCALPLRGGQAHAKVGGESTVPSWHYH